MKNQLYLVIFVPSLLFIACQNDNIHEINDLSAMQCVNNTISITDAIQTLENFMSVAYPETKAEIRSKIETAEIEVLGAGNLFQNTKNAPLSLSIPDTLIYSINFANDAGYALLAADRRLPEKIYAVTEKGRFDIENVETLEEQYLSYDQYNELEANEYDDGNNDEDYDLDNEEVLYEDYLCNDESIENEEGFLDIGSLAANILLLSKIEQDSHNVQTIQQIPNSSDPESQGGYSCGESYEKYGPFVKTIWKQEGDPYNNKTPNKKKHEGRCAAGCVNIAVSQILVANKKLGTNTLNNRQFNYSLMETVGHYSKNTPSQQAKDEVADFIKAVGSSKYCSIIYGTGKEEESSSGMSLMAARTFRKVGYNNVMLHNCSDADKINHTIQMIKAGRPVYFSGTKPLSQGFFEGHAWVIDGYIPAKNTNENSLFHINWGWGGYCNGYFAVGIFDTSKRNSKDQTVDANVSNQLSDTKYTFNFVMITYN